jgi:NADPH:quinone reductase-like Zn-dependent oxidoreductase
VDRNIPDPSEGQVLINFQACGICHGDSITKQGLFQGIQYPRVPGHEVAGVVEGVGKDVIGWKPGQRVAVGWDGMVVIVVIVNPVEVEIFLCASMQLYLEFLTTVGIQTIWLHQR